MLFRRFRWPVAFVLYGVAWLAGLYLLGGAVDGPAYWVIGGAMLVVGIAGAVWLARQGMKASISDSARRFR
jgi:4-amino-4-deoxy-L-arabinose transferase-like glycosyltransferase